MLQWLVEGLKTQSRSATHLCSLITFMFGCGAKLRPGLELEMAAGQWRGKRKSVAGEVNVLLHSMKNCGLARTLLSHGDDVSSEAV